MAIFFSYFLLSFLASPSFLGLWLPHCVNFCTAGTSATWHQCLPDQCLQNGASFNSRISVTNFEESGSRLMQNSSAKKSWRLFAGSWIWTLVFTEKNLRSESSSSELSCPVMAIFYFDGNSLCGGTCPPFRMSKLSILGTFSVFWVFYNLYWVFYSLFWVFLGILPPTPWNKSPEFAPLDKLLRMPLLTK